MTTPSEFGRAVPPEVIPLPDLDFDMLGGRAAEALGKTETPVTVLPEMALDMLAAAATPVLRLTVHLRPGAPPDQAALDLFRLYAAVNQLEVGFGGAGLTPSNVPQDGPEGERAVRIAFAPADPRGATERLTKLAGTINQPDNAALRDTSRSIERCVAQIEPLAA